jgi:hypothetical protein
MSTARKAFVETMVYGESHLLIDFPKVEGEAQTRAEEDAWAVEAPGRVLAGQINGRRSLRLSE